MCPKHRSETLEEIKGKLNSGAPVKVVATQLIEAGVDIDFPVVYRSACGLDSLAQAAGRCNREGKMAGLGTVYSFASSDENLRGYLQRTSVHGANARDLADYFQRLYSSEDNDKKRIMELLDKKDFFFETVSDMFKLIEDDGIPVVVPWDKTAIDLIEKLRYAPSKDTLRSLRPYVVNVRRKIVPQLTLANVSGLIDVLDISHYDPKMGIKDNNGAEAWFV
jgi:CRISPR-associated endonuclease/helicase Cas3